MKEKREEREGEDKEGKRIRGMKIYRSYSGGRDKREER